MKPASESETGKGPGTSGGDSEFPRRQPTSLENGVTGMARETWVTRKALPTGHEAPGPSDPFDLLELLSLTDGFLKNGFKQNQRYLLGVRQPCKHSPNQESEMGGMLLL